jgi:hypothetical protein
MGILGLLKKSGSEREFLISSARSKLFSPEELRQE